MKLSPPSILRQCLAVYVLALVAMIAARIAGEGGMEWTAGALMLLLFAVVNPVAGIFADKWLTYTARSAGSLVLLHVPVMATASLVSIKTIEDIRENAMVYLAPVLYYPVMVAVTGAVRIVITVYRGRKSDAGRR